MTIFFRYAIISSFLLCSGFITAQVTIFPFESSWKYSDNTSQPSNQGGNAWYNKAYDDSSWSSGNGQLGYGDGDEGTVINSVFTGYFRKEINLPDLCTYSDINMTLLYDDGAVIYINGAYYGRVNMPNRSNYNYGTRASSVSSDNATISIAIPLTEFTSGTNTVAVEVHQRSSNSSDLSFDMEITATEDSALVGCLCNDTAVLDTDGDSICDGQDVCPTLDNSLIGTACDDMNPCTTGDTYLAATCQCEGTLNDADGDGVCDDVDVCPGFDDNLIGTPCDDADPCTENDAYDATSCSCVGTVIINGSSCDDMDPCTENDLYDAATCSCVGTLIVDGSTCDDMDPCTINDLYDATACDCIGTFADADNDGVCDADDVCPMFDDMLIGTACDDNKPCTENDVYDGTTCACAGTYLDTDGDGVCNANDECEGLDDALIGTSCDDGNICTTGDVYSAVSCMCEGTFQDIDNDTVCDAEDQCDVFDDRLIGTACDDNNPCTVNDIYVVLATSCGCIGTFQDTDGDNICDANDSCPTLDNSLIGTACDDGDACTIDDVYGVDCECNGTFEDTDMDAVCDAEDQCPGTDDAIIGTPCDDGDICTINDIYTSTCDCVGTYADTDNDTFCDGEDICPGFDDRLIGTSCDDGNICTDNDTYMTNCACEGTFNDADSDGICDKFDVCPGDDGLCTGYEVGSFVNCNNTTVNIPNDFSGVTYNEDTGTLFGVRNGTPEAYELNLDGTIIRRITLRNFEDTEGIVYLGNNKYAVTEERRRRIVVITIPNGNNNITIQYPSSASRIQLNGTGTGNIGLEAVAYDKLNDILYVGKEINNMAIYTLENPISLLGTSFTPLQLFSLQNKSSSYPPNGGGGFSDLAGLSFTDNGTFLALSHEAEHIVEIHPYTGEVISSIDITGFNMTQPEGVTYISPDEIIIVGEPNEMVYAKRVGISCDDGDDCTVNDAIDANCDCVGVFLDDDNDSVCDFDDICPSFNDNAIGQACNDGNSCTSNDVYTTNCECKGTFDDADSDMICDANDSCPNLNNALIGQACDDSNPCTINDTWMTDCDCKGTFTDSDSDGTCDANDQCNGLNDGLIGQPCNDNNACTTGDKWQSDCTCTGTFTDTDNDNVCDANDACPNDPNKSASVGICGCGNVDVDQNNDGLCDTDCIDHLTIGSVISNGYTYEARLTITSDAVITGNSTYNYSAGQEINLNPGFEVNAGTTFHAYILGCNNQ